MAVSLLRDWCRGLDVDMHRALLVTGIPEGLERAAIEAVLQPAFLPLGTFRLWNARAARDHKAKAALVEFVQDINHASVPREIPGKDGVWRVVCQDPAEDPGVLRQMRRLVLDERPSQAAGPGAARDTLLSRAWEPRAQGSEPAARRAGPPPRRGRRARRNRARGNRWAPKGQKSERGGRRPTWARRESGASSEGSLGIVLEELDPDDLSADEAQSALSATLHQAAQELSKKEWALRSGADAGQGPREFLALVTVTDRAKREPTEKGAPGPEAVSLDGGGEGRSRRVPDLVALLAVRDAGDEEPAHGDAPESESQPNGEPGDEALDNPEFVAIVAYTDPSDAWARDELLKIASVIESLGWSARRDATDALREVLGVLSQDTGGARVKVEEAGRQLDALVLRQAADGGSLRECICALAAPDPPAPGKRARRGPLAGWGDGEGGLLELVALLAARDSAGLMPEAGERAREGGRRGRAGGQLGEVLALLAAREGAAAAGGPEAAAEAAESEQSQPEPRASGKARAKRARTASGALGDVGEAGAAPAPSGSRRRRGGGGGGGGRAVSLEPPAEDRAAAHGKKKGRAGAGAHVQADEARAPPPPGSESAGGRKARRGGRQPPKRR
ncbi:paraneoplastic antigen-like protein 8B [Neomonachus schauinslandi]|uniref:Paraneoplastic antigen-like protein 8B n=1 Tax=Neomonachus schauinslandi TaxID=29088 RepID=A0A2Y9GXL2_NEOSC|nr:paraneoplastic antigen-like protein 8B [Neomonachus schauinslandi]